MDNRFANFMDWSCASSLVFVGPNLGISWSFLLSIFRMDSSTACQIAVWATPNLKPRIADFQLVVDRDSTNLKDLTDDVAAKFDCGANQGLNLSFYNKRSKCYSTLTTDSMLMDAIDMYWDLRRLVVYVGCMTQLQSHIVRVFLLMRQYRS
jgi:hypothetical protein